MCFKATPYDKTRLSINRRDKYAWWYKNTLSLNCWNYSWSSCKKKENGQVRYPSLRWQMRMIICHIVNHNQQIHLINYIVAWEQQCSMCHFEKKRVLLIIFIVTISSFLTQLKVKEKGVKSLDINNSFMFHFQNLNLSFPKRSILFAQLHCALITCDHGDRTFSIWKSFFFLRS